MGSVQAANFSAQVDRYVLEEGESLELKLKVDDSSLLNQPDYSALNQSFEVLNESRSSQLQIINGQSQSSTVWTLTLMPKSTGELIIPAISLKNLRSQPITINVNKTSDSATTVLETTPQIMVEAVVDKTQVLVQEQVLLSVRLLYQGGVQISQWALSEPDAGDAVVRELGSSTQYEKQIGNLKYGVLERRYAIFPQSSGTLEIKPIIFDGIVHEGRRSHFLGRGQQIRHRSHAITLNVAPQNSQFKYKVWLPAKKLRLEERWSSAPDQLKIGDSITRILTLTALGQSSATLPPLELNLPEDLKSYPDKADLDESINSEGLLGKRTESIAIIPSHKGEYIVPALEVPWWDTVNQKVQIARLPERRISVTAATGSSATHKQTPAAVEPQTQASTSLVDPPLTTNSASALESEIKKWRTATVVLAILLFLILLFFLVKLWYPRRSFKQVSHPGKVETKDCLKLSQAYTHLLATCQTNNCKELQTALLNWGACYYEKPVHSLGELAACLNNEDMKKELQELEKRLYGHNSESDPKPWQAERLCALIKQMPASFSASKPSATDKLVHLYPNV
jgi:hypothetical protein